MESSYIWLGLFVVFLIIEAAIPGLVSIWFAFGALCALLSTVFVSAIHVQAAVFTIGSLAALLLMRPLCNRLLNKARNPTNADRILGRKCTVTETIDNLNGKGKAVWNGSEWTARSISDDLIISSGEIVIAIRIEGAKLIVKPYRERNGGMSAVRKEAECHA